MVSHQLQGTFATQATIQQPVTPFINHPVQGCRSVLGIQLNLATEMTIGCAAPGILTQIERSATMQNHIGELQQMVTIHR